MPPPPHPPHPRPTIPPQLRHLWGPYRFVGHVDVSGLLGQLLLVAICRGAAATPTGTPATATAGPSSGPSPSPSSSLVPTTSPAPLPLHAQQGLGALGELVVLQRCLLVDWQDPVNVHPLVVLLVPTIVVHQVTQGSTLPLHGQNLHRQSERARSPVCVRAWGAGDNVAELQFQRAKFETCLGLVQLQAMVSVHYAVLCEHFGLHHKKRKLNLGGEVVTCTSVRQRGPHHPSEKRVFFEAEAANWTPPHHMVSYRGPACAPRSFHVRVTTVYFFVQGDDLYLQPFRVGSFGMWFPVGWVEEAAHSEGPWPTADVR
jgi:hypothetical protein